MSELAERNDAMARLAEARNALHLAFEHAGFAPGPGVGLGQAQAFRDAIWALHPNILTLVPRSPEDLAIAAAMDACAKAWAAYAARLPEDDPERRVAERAAQSIGYGVV